MRLIDANHGTDYVVKRIHTDDEELVSFLFSLGCYVGEAITVVSNTRSGYVLSIKDARYNVDSDLVRAIEVEG
ncbi:MAG: ferrous iron transport protein A [Saccharofermentans sp.]|nr:ferrous iron transport protein A [Saccharofermentans sp.]